MEEKTKKVLGSLQTLCARREYCSADMYAKALSRLDGDERAAAEVVEALVRDRYVDDARYAAAFARDKASLDGWGPVKIRYALTARRLDRACIDAALSQVDADQASGCLRALLTARWKQLKGDPQARLKLIRYALSRGYEYAQVEALVREVSAPDQAI